MRWTSRDEQDGSGVACTNLEVREGADGIWTDWFACNTGTLLAVPGSGRRDLLLPRPREGRRRQLGQLRQRAPTATPASPSTWRPRTSGGTASTSAADRSRSSTATAAICRPATRCACAWTARPRRAPWTSSTARRRPRSATICASSSATRPSSTGWSSTCTSSTIDMLFRTHAAIPATTLDGTSYALYYGNAAAGAPPADRNDVLYPALDSNTLRAYDMLEGTGLTLSDASLTSDASMNGALGWERQGQVRASRRRPGRHLQRQRDRRRHRQPAGARLDRRVVDEAHRRTAVAA